MISPRGLEDIFLSSDVFEELIDWQAPPTPGSILPKASSFDSRQCTASLRRKPRRAAELQHACPRCPQCPLLATKT